jgi:hypothetical protein
MDRKSDGQLTRKYLTGFHTSQCCHKTNLSLAALTEIHCFGLKFLQHAKSSSFSSQLVIHSLWSAN